MSFDQLSAMERGSGGQNDGAYTDDPDFSSLSRTIESSLFTIQSNISKLSKQVSLLSTKRETPRVRERVLELLNTTTEDFKDLLEHVNTLEEWTDVTPSQKYTQQKLWRNYQAAHRDFQTIHTDALPKLRASEQAARAALEEATSPGVERQGEFGSQSQQTQQTQQQQQQQETLRLADQSEVDFQDTLIVEREANIRSIEAGLVELNEVFRDVAHIVSEQGEQLDSIAANVENTRSDTRGADVELRSASRYQKNARGKMCMLLLILAVIFTVILLAAFAG